MNGANGADAHDDTWDVVLVNGVKHRVDGATFNAIQSAAAGQAEDTGWLVDFHLVDSEGKPSSDLLMVNVQHVLTIRPYKSSELYVTSLRTRRR